MSSPGADVETQVHRFAWRGIEIGATYDPAWSQGFAHLAVRSVRPERAPLPITETGYRSHFHRSGTIEAHGGDVVVQVIAWLDEEAAKPGWQRHVEASRQGSLF